MFPKFIQVYLYSGEAVYTEGGGSYIRDVNWVTYLGGMYSGGLIYRGCINGILRYFNVIFLCNIRNVIIVS